MVKMLQAQATNDCPVRQTNIPATMMFLLRGLLPFLLLSTSLTQGQNTKEFDDDDYTVSVKINSNQPRYYYWAKDDPRKSKYRVAFSKIYETTTNGDKVGGSNLALSSINWVIEKDQASTDSVVFWINGTTNEKGNGNKAVRFSVLSFRNEIVNDAIKFDVIVENYSWIDPNAASLALEWKMTNSTGANSDTDQGPVRQRMGRYLADEVPASESDDMICWYGAGGDSENQVCWKIVDEAAFLKDGSSKPLPVTLDLDGGFIKVSYKNWGEDGVGSLIHDPEFDHVLGTTFTDNCAAWGPLAIICYIISFLLGLLGLA